MPAPTEQQLVNAFKAAADSGDEVAAKAFASELKKMQQPAKTSAAGNVPDYKTILAQGFDPDSKLDRYRRGVQDIVDRGAQLSIDVGEKIGAIQPGIADTATKQINTERDAYEKLRQDSAKRQGKDKAGFDVARTLGTASVLSPLGLVAPLAGISGTSIGALAASGAIGGGLSGALSYDPSNTLKQGTVNTAVGAGAGAILGPVLGKASEYTGKALGSIFGRVKGAVASLKGETNPAKIIQAVPEIQGLPPQQRTDLIAEAAQQVRSTGALNAEALGRKANLVANGVTPLKSAVTRSPQDWALERNLSKLTGPDPELAKVGGELTDVYRANDAALGNKLRSFGANKPQGSEEALGQAGMEALKQVSRDTQKEVGDLYEIVRSTRGDELASDARQLVTTLDDLGDSTYAEKLVGSVRNKLKRFGMIDSDGALTNKTLTVTQAEELRKFVNRLPNDFGKRDIIEAIDQDVLGGLGDDAFGTARAAASDRKELLANPATQKALNTLGEVEQGKTAQNFIRQQVVNASDQDLDALLKTLAPKQQAIDSLRAGVLQHFENAAVNPNSGQFSGANLNKELVRFGDKKLLALFGSEEAGKLKSLARAGLDATYQPPYSAVNSSNTTPTALSLARRGRQVIGFDVPFVNEAVEQQAARSGYQSQLAKALQSASTPSTESETARALALALSRAGPPAVPGVINPRNQPGTKRPVR